MRLFPTSKIILSIGSLHVTWYAVLILSGAMIAYFLSLRTLKRQGYPKTLLEDFFVPMLLVAIVGARLYYVIFEWDTLYVHDPIRIFYVWEGGLAIHGGLLAGIGFGIWYFRKKKVNGLRIMDAVFPNILVAQALGRWGNFVNQEAYGAVVDEAYYNGWPSFIKEKMLINGAYRQPTFLYESVANLIGFVLIAVVFKRYGRKKRGDLAWAYFAWYGAVRFVIESMRSDALMLGSLRIAQLVSLLFVFIGVCGLFGLWDRLFAGVWPFRREKPAVIFDLDGTLIDSRALVYASFEHSMKVLAARHEISEEEKDAFFGPPLKVSYAKYFDTEEEIEQAVKEYRRFYTQHHDEYVTVFEGVHEVLTELQQQGYPMAVVSNKMKDTLQMALDRLQLRGYFSSVIGGDEVEKAKPDPQGLLKACEQLGMGHDDLIYVGDSDADIMAAKAIAAYSIAYVSDTAREPGLRALRPCSLIYDFRELGSIVKEEREWSDTTIL